jgi:hypothetical protein
MVIHGKVHHGSDVGRACSPNHPIPDNISIAFSSEVDTGSREENASK